ncbi:MAG: hypothetical protein RR873_04345 [Christensenella sp.]
MHKALACVRCAGMVLEKAIVLEELTTEMGKVRSVCVVLSMVRFQPLSRVMSVSGVDGGFIGATPL